MNNKFFLILTIIIFLSGCQSQLSSLKLNNNVSAVSANIEVENTVALSLEDKARLSDIPFVHDCEPRLVLVTIPSERKYTLLCDSTYSLQEAIDYYRAEMEYLGWREELVITADRSCLVFKKPTKSCIVFIQQKNVALGITIFVGPRSLYQ